MNSGNPSAYRQKIKSWLSVEYGRKAVHLSSVWIPLFCYFGPFAAARLVLGIAAIGMAAIDVLRLTVSPFRRVFHRIIGPVVRARETDRLTGASYMLFSCFTAFNLYGHVIAAVVSAYLVLGDTAAALVGIKWGKFKIFDKTLTGSLACFTLCLIIGLIVPELGKGAALVGALVATAVELLPLKIDDNVLIPLVTGGVLYWLAGC